MFTRKDRNAVESAQRELNHKHPEPMTLLNKRAFMLGLHNDEYPPYRKPEVTLGMIDKAATAQAQWDNSDPFAYGRTALWVKQGYAEPNEVIKDTLPRILSRRAARIKEIEDAKSKT